MSEFRSRTDLMHNNRLIADPAGYAEQTGAASWLYLCGESSR
jgi:hypothetical protein